MIEKMLSLYPSLASVQPTLDSFCANHSAQSIPANTRLFEENHTCAGFPLLLDGVVQVSSRSREGRSIALYRVRAGELCLVSCASLFRKLPLAAYGQTTSRTTLLLIPPPIFHQWLNAPAFRDEVLGLFATRMLDLTALIDAITFYKLDQRLAAALLARGRHVSITHQALADELGTVREMVTRLLRRFEQEDWVCLSRESIRIDNEPALRALAAGG